MNPFVGLLPVICACIMTQACATHPVSNSVAPDKSASPRDRAGASLSPIPTNAPVHRTYLEDKTLTNEEVKQLFAQGYKPVGRNGQVYYCRSESQTGSRFATMICKSAEQIKQHTQDSKDLLSEKQRAGGCATTNGGC